MANQQTLHAFGDLVEQGWIGHFVILRSMQGFCLQ
jgi:hypothetical protein